MFLHFFYAEFKLAAKNWQANKFWQKVTDHSTDTLGIKHFAKIAQSCTVSEINVFWLHCVFHH